MKRDFGTAAIGGGVGGLLDAIYATVLWGFILGGSPTGIWQSVASGLIGKSSYDGGTATAALGLALHFFIAFVMAAPPTRDTDTPTSIAGRWLAAKRSDCKKIWPSVMEMTLVGM